MSARKTYLCQIQACNIILILLGLTAVALTGSQFSSAGLGNYRKIDLRLLNWIYVLTGLVGLYSLARNHGTVVAKTLYCVCIPIGIATTTFYCITLYRVVEINNRLGSYPLNQRTRDEYHEIGDNYAGKIVICSLMIAVPAIATVVSLAAALLLDRLIVVTQPSWPAHSRDQDKKYRSSRLRLTTVAAIKLFVALCALALAILLEYEHEFMAADSSYIIIALDHIAALLTVTSAVVDLHAAVINRQPATNFKVAIGMSIISSVWCLKMLDVGMYPFYYKDIYFWYNLRENDQMNQMPMDSIYTTVIVEGILMGLFAILFAVNILTALQAGQCIRVELYEEKSIVEKSIAMQSRCLGLFHIFWSLILMALVVLGLIHVNWNTKYIGADMLWLAVLFFCSGMCFVAHTNTLVTPQFVLSFVCFACSLEKMCATINLVYQSASDSFSNSDVYIGRLVLNCVQLATLAAEMFTAFVSLWLCGTAIRRQNRAVPKHPICIHLIMMLGNFFYGVVLTGCYVVFALGYWRYSEEPLEVPFWRRGNGVLVFAIGLLQVATLCYPALLLAVTILNVIAASIALFVVSYCITNTYELALLLGEVSGIRWVIMEVALILAAASALACVICTFCATFAALSGLYAMHRKPRSSASTVVPYEDNYGTVRTLVSPQMRTSTGYSQSPPVRHMEEQSIYWSADENPCYYQACKRYYDQPYKIDSGFYGYALVSPQMLESPYMMMQDTGRRIRGMNSTAAQTRIGHVFG